MSSLDHHKANAKRGASALAHVGVSHGSLYPHRAVRHAHGETLNYPVSSQTILHKTTTHSIFQSTSSTENAFTSGGFVDIRIPAGTLQVVKGFTLALEIQNATGGTVGLPPIPFLLDRLEVLAEAGNVQLARWEPAQLWWPFRHVEQASWDFNYKNALTLAGGNLANNSGPTSFYIPLIGDCFCRNEAYLGHLRSDLYFRVWFRGASAFVNSGPPTLNTLSVICEQDVYAPHERMQIHDRAISQSLDYRFGRPGFQSISETLAANTRYSFQLSAVMGLLTEMIITIRSSGAVGSGTYAYRSWVSYEILDGAGASLTGGMPITAAYQKNVVDASRQSSGAIDTLSPASTPIVVEFGNAKADFLHGSVTGYIPFSGTERLVIITDAFLPTTAYEIRIEYLSVARVNIDRGRISVLPS